MSLLVACWFAAIAKEFSRCHFEYREDPEDGTDTVRVTGDTTAQPLHIFPFQSNFPCIKAPPNKETNCCKTLSTSILPHLCAYETFVGDLFFQKHFVSTTNISLFAH